MAPPQPSPPRGHAATLPSRGQLLPASSLGCETCETELVERKRKRENERGEAERGRGRQRERARPFGPGPVQAQPRALGAAWACLTIGPRLERKAGMWGIGHSKARLRTRTAKALWLPVRLGARARLSASVTAAPSRSRDREGGREHCRAELWAPRRA
ncbi:unnamed protein product [Prorocentrum cordatum]|uniref:Uncharacterized protein n=1 Tax=Prorocentrum cordatum TaxID=2364126 RepID=A0ABN9TGD7_9DINO|nr:unnamed protein product [Polarella glacialis]